MMKASVIMPKTSVQKPVEDNYARVDRTRVQDPMQEKRREEFEKDKTFSLGYDAGIEVKGFGMGMDNEGKPSIGVPIAGADLSVSEDGFELSAGPVPIFSVKEKEEIVTEQVTIKRSSGNALYDYFYPKPPIVFRKTDKRTTDNYSFLIFAAQMRTTESNTGLHIEEQGTGIKVKGQTGLGFAKIDGVLEINSKPDTIVRKY